MPDYELAAYGPAQREDYLRLLHDAWGDDALSGAEFDWWFSRNPGGSLMSNRLADVGGADERRRLSRWARRKCLYDRPIGPLGVDRSHPCRINCGGFVGLDWPGGWPPAHPAKPKTNQQREDVMF